MKRRRILAGVGALASAGGLGLGSGAFTNVSAERNVSIDVTDDNRAFLRLEPITDEGLNDDSTLRSVSDGSTVTFQIPGSGSGESGADGVGTDSTYEFHDLLKIQNQGTQPVEIDSEYGGDVLADLALVTDSGLLRDDPPLIDTGDSVDVGLYIDTHGVDTGDYDVTLTINAVAPDASN